MTTHSFPVRIYYEDTDFSGNVYHAAYLKFFERARTEFLRENGIHHSELAAQGIAFAVRSMQLEFIGAAHIDDLLSVSTQVVAATGARLKLEQKIFCDDTLLTTAQLDVVAIKTSGGPARLPAVLRALAP
ncbi:MULTISPECIES: tol-pal system-associated acyl-CoA thioesterase [unclassified Devosia]|uniref:tol-pal system-associated acyl-CoA thioesterase n=1 Tax=unclassified Devosia TaxID=196773 RepID=UPI00145F684F|nr:MULTISPECIES: tol-pal system-associated acyl-CoA thioesterase [unclassified Devosia]MBJ6987955.1 tol-pal system-associated acyl-CoA thioesterase [Devosia sp. MC521]MBK1794686.1 tol-pal system-associated acyl-CoA thioesterase [Devosia sp. WQ 349K1]QMW62032.1 tol-pal system-associated acyl-CoA thioesterase [Devosia sp. MC521]